MTTTCKQAKTPNVLRWRQVGTKKWGAEFGGIKFKITECPIDGYALYQSPYFGGNWCIASHSEPRDLAETAERAARRAVQ